MNECNHNSDDIVREIQGIGIKNYATYNGDHIINFNEYPLDKDVGFPVSEKEEIIISYKDRCMMCDEYLGEPYNIIYKFKETILKLNKGEYNGQIHAFRLLNDVETDEVGLDPLERYICLELVDYTEKIYIQKTSWDEKNKRILEVRGRALKVGDYIFDLTIDSNHKIMNYSYEIDKDKVD